MWVAFKNLSENLLRAAHFYLKNNWKLTLRENMWLDHALFQTCHIVTDWQEGSPYKYHSEFTDRSDKCVYTQISAQTFGSDRRSILSNFSAALFPALLLTLFSLASFICIYYLLVFLTPSSPPFSSGIYIKGNAKCSDLNESQFHWGFWQSEMI